MQTVNKHSNFEHKPYKLSTYYTRNPKYFDYKAALQKAIFLKVILFETQVSNKNTPFNVQLYISEVSSRVTQTEGWFSENWNYHDNSSTTTAVF